MDSLAVLNPNDPSPGYCIYTGIAGDLTNRVFELFYENGLRMRLITSSAGGYRYNEESDSIEVVGLAVGITQQIIDGSGIAEVSVANPFRIDNFTKGLITYKALPVEQP